MANSRHPDHSNKDCDLTVFQRVGVTGEVTITPKVECGPIKITCLDGEIVPCDDLSDHWDSRTGGDERCKILIFQELCVEVPVRFKVKAECDLTGIRCGEASTDPYVCHTSDCSDDSSGSCSHSFSDSSSGCPDSSGSSSDSSGSSSDSSSSSSSS